MGRGQLFAFGMNCWETGSFTMTVDIKRCGLDYELSTRAKKTTGCKIVIQLYDKLLPSQIGAIERELDLWCRWAPISVFVNEQAINRDPALAKWDPIASPTWPRRR
jgi:hypothetical protein